MSCHGCEGNIYKSVSEYFQPFPLLSAIPLDCKMHSGFRQHFPGLKVNFILENMVHCTKTDHMSESVFFGCMFKISSGSL
jgi:hypothetical protein